MSGSGDVSETLGDVEQLTHAPSPDCGCNCCQACARPKVRDLAAVLMADDVLRAQMAHEAAVRVRYRYRQEVRDCERQGIPYDAACERYEGAVMAEARALRALHVAIAADMGIEP